MVPGRHRPHHAHGRDDGQESGLVAGERERGAALALECFVRQLCIETVRSSCLRQSLGSLFIHPPPFRVRSGLRNQARSPRDAQNMADGS